MSGFCAISSVSMPPSRERDNTAKSNIVYYSTQIDEMPMNGMYILSVADLNY